MKKDPRVYLAHILECIQRIGNFTQPGLKTALIALLPPLDQLESELAGDDE